ncbi:MAG: c-type cytochrome [Saprospiraceae bacterium]
MKVKLFSLFMALGFLLSAGGGGGNDSGTADNNAEPVLTPEEKMLAEGKGVGEVKAVELTTPLDQTRITRGKDVYDMKCAACHRLDETRVVGPGWKGLTEKRKPEWIMNMITNVEVMLEKDKEAQDLLQLCLTRMPNQNVSIGDARDILEFMRKNDGVE